MEPTLYIIMRSDIQDMNPGKAMAQAAHAQAEFDAHMAELTSNSHDEKLPSITFDYAEWLEERCFGRTIVLSATQKEIEHIAEAGNISGVTVDPTYPWKNHYGEIFLTEEVTCGWLFVSDENIVDSYLVNELPLHQ